ncbi:NAD-dependent epimerase/dehydratase family protein [Pseudoalteromonas agarivorans]|uniref:NAD-dependent epimerase/dehydratase family protein n=1 Tax=Pseudoalteromonas agarivorans TaxID=176102 RepID=UPI00249B7662|nr:NAD-dependent epimerase/dehydratase family protein [Pseudoalteromonas agarivorans]MDI3244592.1 NAD(P)-dependent oxidoreductase [Pseudoalteromonas agarivorans]
MLNNTGLIGSTGFVGSNICCGLENGSKLFNSKNIQEITDQKFDVLYITAIQAKKWWANQNAEEDKALIDGLFEHLETVKANKVVFISTVDVYQPPLNADEDTPSNKDIHAYGANRLYAEEKVKSLFVDVHIIRLQGLVANNLTKNIVFDLKNKNILETINPESALQWYPLSRLNRDIEKVIEHNIPLINLSVEPVKTQDIINIAPLTADEKAIVSTNPMNPAFYDVKSKYAELFDGKNGYIVSAEESLAEIQKYFKS